MARILTGSQSLSQPTAVVTAAPMTLACWVNMTSIVGTQVAMCVSDGGGQNIFTLEVEGGLPAATAVAQPTVTVAISSGASIGTGTWHHLCAVFASSISRTIYVDGVAQGSNSTPVTPGTLSGTFIGVRVLSHFFIGLVALPGIWSIALSPTQVGQLFTSFYPSTVSTGLVVAPPLSSGFSPEPDPVLGTPWTVTGASSVSLDPNASVVPGSSFSDANQAGLTEGVGWTTYSYYLQPWKSYMDTWSGQRFLDGLGVNFRPGIGNERGTASVLASAGFTHARMEFGWSRLQYPDDTQIGTDLTNWTNALLALQSFGIRPLILLNNNLGGICPFTSLSLTASATSAIGATTITVSSTTGIVVGKTGLGGQKSGYQVYPFITAFNAGTGVCNLSAPLLVQVTSGNAIPCVTLKYHPLCTGGLANSFSSETKIGWATYTRTICTFVSGVLGNNNYDVEVYNEDSSALDDNNFYSPANSTTGALTYTSTVYPSYTLNGNTAGAGDNRDVIVPITVDVVLTSFPGVRIINGRGNIRPQDCAYNTPPGVTAFSRHNYTNLNNVATCNGVYGVSNPSNPINATLPPTNAILGYDGVPAGTTTSPTPPNPVTVNSGSFFIPTFTLSCPESYVGMGMKAEWMCTDLLPFPSLRIDGPASTIYRGPHGRGGLNPITGQTVGLWETETNTDRKVWVNGIMTPTNRDTDPASIALWMYAGAKSLLRMFVFYIHKGMQTVCAFADRNIAEPYVLSIIPEAFFTALAANGGVLTPAIQALAGSQIAAMTNMTSFIKANSSGAFAITPLQVGSVAENSPGMEWAGDATPAHPDQLNVNNFGIFPFQLAANTYAIAYYVVTHNVVNNYGINGNVLDPINYTMPDKGFIVTLNGINGNASTIACYDPLTNTSPAVSVIASTTNSITVNVVSSDYPRFITISTSTVSAGNLDVVFYEFSAGSGSTWSFDIDSVSGTNAGTTSANSGATGQTRQTNELLIGACAANGTTVTSGDSGGGWIGSVTGLNGWSEYLKASSLSTYTSSFTLAASGQAWSAAIGAWYALGMDIRTNITPVSTSSVSVSVEQMSVSTDSFVQAASNRVTNTGAITCPVTITASAAGNLLVVYIGALSSGAVISSVTDNKGDIYTLAFSDTVPTTSLFCYQCLSCISGVTTVTVVSSAAVNSNTLDVAVYEMASVGAWHFDKFSVAGANNAGTTSVSAGTTPATTFANEVVISACFANGASVTAGTAGFTGGAT